MFRSSVVVFTVAASLMLQACGGGGSGGSPAPSPTPPGPTSKTLALNGIVDRLVSTGASVAVQHGTTVERGTVAGDNKFTVPISYTDSTEFVTVQVSGVLNNAKVVFQSNLGTIRALELAAAPAAALSYTTFTPLHISSTSTAQNGLIVTGSPPPPGPTSTGSKPAAFKTAADNPVAPVQTDADLAAALALLDPVQVLNLAGSIELVANNVIDLPPGATTTLDAASNASQQQALVSAAIAAPGNALSNQIALIQTDQAQQVALTPSSIPAQAYFSPSFRGFTGTGYRFDFNQNGTGRVIAPINQLVGDAASSAAYQNSDDFRWVINADNAIELSLTNGLIYNYTQYDYDPNGNQTATNYQSVTTRVLVTPVVTVSDTDRFAATVREIGTTYNLTDTTQAPESYDGTQAPLYGQFVSTTSAIPYTRAQVAGSVVTGETFNLPNNRSFSGATVSKIVRFSADGTGRTFVSDPLQADPEATSPDTFTWTIADDGGLRIHATDPSGTYITTLHKINVLDSLGNAEVVADYSGTDSGGTIEGAYAFTSAVFDPTARFDAGTVAGSYNQFGTLRQAATPGAIDLVRLDFLSDQTQRTYFTKTCTQLDVEVGTYGCTTPGATVSLSSGRRDWTVVSETDPADPDLTAISILRSDGGRRKSDGSRCVVSASDPDCVLYDRRDMRLMNRVGTRIFVLEYRAFYQDTVTNPDGSTVDEYSLNPLRTLFYDITALPSSSAASASSRVPGKKASADEAEVRTHPGQSQRPNVKTRSH